MSNQDKTLKETLTEVIGGNTDTTKTTEGETEQGIFGKETEGETKSGDTPDYVSGIDISDIPEQDRPRIKELLSKKAKLLEDGYQGKFKEVADFKRAQDELVNAGLTTAEARDVLVKYIESKRTPPITTEKKEALKTLDKLISEAPYEQRSALEQMRTIILEETGVSALREKVDKMEKLLGIYQRSAMDQREKQITVDLNILSDKYGKDLIDKYRNVITEKGIQYPNMSVSKIFAIEVPIEDIEQAILSKGKKPLTEEKKKAISSPSSGVTSSMEKIDIKGSTYADILLKGFGK